MNSEWSLVIRPRGRRFDLRLKELWRYRDLVLLFVHRDLVSRYKQTILGPLWYIVQPLATSTVFTLVFGGIANMSTDETPKFLFYLSGTVAWSYFADCFTKTHNTFVTNANVFGKVYFPRLAVPVSVVISNIAAFCTQLMLLVLCLLLFHLRGSVTGVNSEILWLPVLIALMGSLGLGLGLIVSALTARYRDLSHLATFGVGLLMYGTPVVYPLAEVPTDFRWILMLNPMTAVVERFRYAFLGRGFVDGPAMAYSSLVTASILLVGVLLFHRTERTFMDTV